MRSVLVSPAAILVGLVLGAMPLRAQYVEHPRLLWTADDIPQLQQKVQGNGTSATTYGFVRAQAQGYLSLSLDSLVSWLGGLNTIPELGLVHFMEAPLLEKTAGPGPAARFASTSYAVKGHDATLNLAFTTSVDNDDYASSLRLRSLALGYDLFFAEASEPARQAVRNEILAYLDFIPTTFTYYRYAENPFASNRGMMVGAAMGLAVIALWDDVSPQVQTTLAPVLDFAHGLVTKCLTDILASDGSYREGVLYAGWMFRHAIPYIEARARFDGVDLSDDPRLARVAEWLCYEVLPEGSGRTNNINDSLWQTRPLAVHSTYLDWAQARYGSALAAYLQRHVAGEYGWDHGSHADKVATVLWNQDLAVVDPAQFLDDGRLFAERGIYYYRSGWKPGATGDEILFSFHSSEFRGGHAQEDQNQFTLYAHGDRYAVDQGSANSSSEPKETRAHNVVLIDGVGQHNAGNSVGTDGEIVEALLSPFADYVRGDAARAYTTYSPFNAPGVPFAGSDWSWGYDGGNPVQRADRTVVWVKGSGLPPYCLMGDDIQKDANVHEYAWAMHTDSSNVVDTGVDPVVITGSQSMLEVLFVHPRPSQGLVVDAGPYVHGGEDPSTMRLRARIDAVEPAFFVALFPQTAGDPPKMAQPGPQAGGTSSELRIDWGTIQDDAVFNPSGGYTDGSARTNAKLAVVRSDGAQPLAYLMGEGTALQWEEMGLVLVDEPASVASDGGTVHLSRQDAQFHAWGPQVTQVLGPDGPVLFDRSGDFVHSVGVSDAEPTPGAGSGPSRLAANRPNPFNAGTRLHFTLARPEHARLLIYDARGRLIRTLVDDALPAGERNVYWDGTDDRGRRQPSGAYLVRLETAFGVSSRKIVVIR